MVEIGDMPILCHIMKTYSAHGLNDFVICLGYKGWVVKEFFADYLLRCSDIRVDLAEERVEILDRNAAKPWRITLVDTGAESMTGGRLKRAARYLDGETFVSSRRARAASPVRSD